MSVWIQALKIFNKDSMWCMPRKGSPEHAKVKKIMDKIKKEPENKKRESEMMAMEDINMTKIGKAGGKRIRKFTRTKPNISSEMEVEMNTLYSKENTGKISRNFIYQVISPTHVALIGYDSGNYSRGGKFKKYSTIKKFK